MSRDSLSEEVETGHSRWRKPGALKHTQCEKTWGTHGTASGSENLAYGGACKTAFRREAKARSWRSTRRSYVTC